MTTNEPQDFQLPEYSGNPFIANLPPILSMAAAVKALNAPPAFHERERSFPDELRVGNPPWKKGALDDACLKTVTVIPSLKPTLVRALAGDTSIIA